MDCLNAEKHRLIYIHPFKGKQVFFTPRIRSGIDRQRRREPYSFQDNGLPFKRCSKNMHAHDLENPADAASVALITRITRSVIITQNGCDK